MTKRSRSSDGRLYWGSSPRELAAACIAHAASDGFALELRADTPVIPMEGFPFERFTPVLTDRGTWGEIDSLARYWGEVGCGWVNLRFALDGAGGALIRYEAKPDGEPLPDDGLPGFNGGFDCRRVMSKDEYFQAHPDLA